MTTKKTDTKVFKTEKAHNPSTDTKPVTPEMEKQAQAAIAKYILEHGEFNTQDAKKLGLNQQVLNQEIQAMIEAGLIGNSKANSGFHFSLTHKGEVYAKTLK